MKPLPLLLAWAWLSPNWAGAHGDVHERLAAVSAELEKNPDDVTRLVQRGELHREHRDWGAALADFDRAARLDPRTFTDFFKGRVLVDANFPREARPLLDRHLKAHPDHPAARLVRARMLASLGEPRIAAADYSAALALAPTPDVFFERAQLLAGTGDLAEAVAGLDEGMKRLGPLPALQDLAVELEIQRKNFDTALARLDALLARAARKEFLLARQAEVCARAGRVESAREKFMAARRALESLPPERREAPAVVELEVRIASGLRALPSRVASRAGDAANLAP